MSDWPKVRLHVVTGKGGTGKSTVAAALALALTAGLLTPGHRMSLLETGSTRSAAGPPTSRTSCPASSP